MYTHIFIDAENVPAKQSVVFYYLACEKYDVNMCDVVGNINQMPKIMLCMEKPCFRIWNSMQGKNSADLWLASLMMKAICEEEDLERIILLSNDRDYWPVIYFAKTLGKNVCIALTTNYNGGMSKLLKKVVLYCRRRRLLREIWLSSHCLRICSSLRRAETGCRRVRSS
ncbi:NYN domain-containing protein [Selenomonas sp. KH1T6]|uniref:NYN domain-containing protein n=1 Tax=Selenomonas sp. KH1T6 TaxID=3158784 RepID=UPI0009430B6A